MVARWTRRNKIQSRSNVFLNVTKALRMHASKRATQFGPLSSYMSAKTLALDVSCSTSVTGAFIFGYKLWCQKSLTACLCDFRDREGSECIVADSEEWGPCESLTTLARSPQTHLPTIRNTRYSDWQAFSRATKISLPCACMRIYVSRFPNALCVCDMEYAPWPSLILEEGTPNRQACR